MEIAVLVIFCISILLSVVFDFSIIYSLVFGYLLFIGYGIYCKYSLKELGKSSLEGILTCKTILFTFILIGMMTALWRASGTIAIFIFYAGKMIQPSIFILLAFLFNCFVSFITGTSLGTASTMGVITMTIGSAMNCNPVMLGGAILSGVYFGDRCSYVSTSALLIATITHTNLYENIKKMVKTSIVPFFISCVIYLVCGLLEKSTGSSYEVLAVFENNYTLSFLCFLPAVMILILAVNKVDVKINMTVSILMSVLLCYFVQHYDVLTILHTAVFGFEAKDITLAKMMNGGGITSMLSIGIVVAITTSYTGLFKLTGILLPLQNIINKVKLPPYAIIIMTTIFIGMISCNQSLPTMLTNDLCKDLEDHETRAIDIENSAIILTPLIPWSIACLMPLTTIGSPTMSILGACYLYLIPVYNLLKK